MYSLQLHKAILFHVYTSRQNKRIKVQYEQGCSPIKLFEKELCSQLRTFSSSFFHLIFSATYFLYYSSHFPSIWFQNLIRNLEVQLEQLVQCKELSCFQMFFSPWRILNSVARFFLLYPYLNWKLKS